MKSKLIFKTISYQEVSIQLILRYTGSNINTKGISSRSYLYCNKDILSLTLMFEFWAYWSLQPNLVAYFIALVFNLTALAELENGNLVNISNAPCIKLSKQFQTPRTQQVMTLIYCKYNYIKIIFTIKTYFYIPFILR